MPRLASFPSRVPCLVLACLLVFAAFSALRLQALPQLPANDVPAFTPPSVLRLANGRMVSSPADWPARRLELLKVVEDLALGHQPPAPGPVSGRELRSELLCQGRVRYRLVRLSFGPGQSLGFDVALFSLESLPGRLPVIVHPSFEATPGAAALPVLPRPPGQGKGVDAFAPVDPLPAAVPGPSSLKPVDPATAAARHLPVLERGYLLAVYHYQDTGEDTTLRLPDGSWAYRSTRFFPAYPTHDWGLLSAWAWGLSRCIDYLETDPRADVSRLAALGHSRLGKAVLAAGALDTRIAVSLPAASGAGGTQLYRLCGETHGGREGLDIELKKYPGWFGPGLYAWRGRSQDLPFDQHFLVALTAPRTLVSLEGSEDHNCTPYALRRSLECAQPAYSLLGAPANSLLAHYAPHKHELASTDWAAALDILDLRWSALDSGRVWNNYPQDK